MTVLIQKPIRFIKNCNCIVNEDELRKAIIWRQESPTLGMKHIYMHGQYPAVSIHKEKIHIHRLLMMFWLNRELPINANVHHIDGNKLNSSRDNLSVIASGTHQSLHNKGRKISDATRNAIIRFNHSRKGLRMRRKRKDITPEMVYNLYRQNLSFNKISIALNLDWGCVKQRYNDFIHDIPELLKTE